MEHEVVVDGVPSGPRYVRYHRAFVAEKGVEERRFSRVGPSHDGDSHVRFACRALFFREMGGYLVKEQGYVLFSERGNGNDIGQSHLVKMRHVHQVFDVVHFVYGDDDGDLEFPKKFHQFVVERLGSGVLEEQDDERGTLELAMRHVEYGLGQFRSRADVEAGSVRDSEGGVPVLHGEGDDVPGEARVRVDDGPALPGERVEES